MKPLQTLTILTALGSVELALAEHPTLLARPKPLCGVPCYPYQSNSAQAKPTVTSTGFERIDIGDMATKPAEPWTKTAATFQMLNQTLQIDHCIVTKLSITLYPNGDYVVNYKADQKPQDIATARSTPRSIDTNVEPLQFTRNQFFLTIRGYAVDPGKETTIGATRAALVQLPLPSVWVKRGESYAGHVEANSDSIKRNYQYIQRFEVDFTYR